MHRLRFRNGPSTLSARSTYKYVALSHLNSSLSFSSTGQSRVFRANKGGQIRVMSILYHRVSSLDHVAASSGVAIVFLLSVTFCSLPSRARSTFCRPRSCSCSSCSSRQQLCFCWTLCFVVSRPWERIARGWSYRKGNRKSAPSCALPWSFSVLKCSLSRRRHAVFAGALANARTHMYRVQRCNSSLCSSIVCYNVRDCLAVLRSSSPRL